MDFVNKLDQFQKNAVETQERNLLVVAAPGSGKTTTIINRVFYLINRKRIDSNNIIVITFTKAAAINMKNRYKKVDSKNKPPYFGTFHSLFYRIVKRHCKDFNIIEVWQSYKIIKSTLENYFDEISDEKVKEVLNDISIFKNSLISMEDFKSNIDKKVFIDSYYKYEEYKEKNNLLDFDDLQLKCRQLFLQDKNILNGYRNLFKYILVDEFQDCDGLQIEILKLLNCNNSLFAVGDEDQCIYSFRGSKPECMVEFEKYFEGGKKVFLSNNYRSPSNIIEVSKKLISNNKTRNNKEIYAVKNETRKINIINSLDESTAANEISNNIIKLNKLSNYSFSDNAILYRTNIESRSLIDVFIRKKIPFKFMDKEYNFFEHFICRDIIAYLKLSINPFDRESFVRIINKPFRYISKVNIEKVKHHREKNNCFDILRGILDIHPFQIKTMDKLEKDINFLNKISLSSAVDYVILSLGYHDYIKEYCTKFKLDIKEIEEIVDEFREACKEYNFINDFLTHVDEVKAEIEKNKKSKLENAVIFSTIHGVKGMEFKNVFIINCNEDIIPHKNNTNIEEERRLFYVGITRTIENLWISISNNIKGEMRASSRFIAELGLVDTKNSLNLFNEGDLIRHKTFGNGKIIYVDNKIIDIEFSGGVRRKLDAVITYNNKLIDNLSEID